MKLLFAQNLSRKLVSRLADIFPDSSHVQFHGLAQKTDTQIWEFASIEKLRLTTAFTDVSKIELRIKTSFIPLQRICYIDSLDRFCQNALALCHR